MERPSLSKKIWIILWMEQNLPVQGDGVVHYYHQGPVFVDNADPAVEEVLRWNPEENKNVKEKDMGAVKGTDIRDLCELIGGMGQGDTLRLKASDGFSRTFAYENVYNYSSSQGPMVLTWYRCRRRICTKLYHRHASRFFG